MGLICGSGGGQQYWRLCRQLSKGGDFEALKDPEKGEEGTDGTNIKMSRDVRIKDKKTYV